MTVEPRIITIDGPACSGKSTAAKNAAQRLGLTTINSGTLYRAITLMHHKLNTNAGSNIQIWKQDLAIWVEKYMDVTIQDGVVIECMSSPVSLAELKTAQINLTISDVSAIRPIRDWVNQRWREYAATIEHGIVCEGRDAGHVIFPDATAKFYMTADAQVRATRADEPLHMVLNRDKADMAKEYGNLLTEEVASRLGYHVIDNSHLSAEDVADFIVKVCEM